MNQTSKNEKKTRIIGPIFAHLARLWGGGGGGGGGGFTSTSS